MSEELKPCPFCGGEARLVSAFLGTAYIVLCDTCNAAIKTRRTEAEAMAAWNTRAERTCNFREIGDYSAGYLRMMRECSECGFWLADDGESLPLFPMVKYCPNCGAKVVD